MQQAQTFSGEIDNVEKLMEHEIYIFQMKHAGKINYEINLRSRSLWLIELN